MNSRPAHLVRAALAAPVPVLVLAALALVAGCATGGEPRERAPRQQQNLLTEAQIHAGTYRTAFEVVQSLRPSWLRERARSVSNPQGAEVAVYLDGVRLGGIGALRQVPVHNISTMQFMTPSDATTRFGTGHAGGAILIVTRRG
jgi:hypothetical protein